jgi:hypothetical protein
VVHHPEEAAIRAHAHRAIAHLRAQWMGALALFLVIAGGTAYAANTVFSSDIVNNQVYSADVRDDTLAGGGLAATDLGSGSVGTAEILNGGVRPPDVQNESLTGADIADQSGVDTCVSTIRIGQLCVRAENSARPWLQALVHCANLDLRAPTLAEALELAQTHDIPNVDQDEHFWTGERFVNSADEERANYSTDAGVIGNGPTDGLKETVCVTNPTN